MNFDQEETIHILCRSIWQNLSNSGERSASPQMTTAAASGSNDVDAAAEDEKEERVRQPAVVSRNGFDEDGKDGKLGQTLIEKDGGGSQEDVRGGESDFTLMPTSSSAGKNRGGRIKRSPPAADDGSLLLLLLLALHFCLRC